MATFTEHYLKTGSISTHTLTLEVELPELSGASDAQVRYGTDSRGRVVRAALHLLVDSPARAADFDADAARRERVLRELGTAIRGRCIAKSWIGASAIELVREALRAAIA